MTVLKNGRYLTPRGGFDKGDIVLHGSEIVSVSENYDAQSDDEVVDISDCLVIPGLIDIHTHGAIGYDVITTTPEQIGELAVYLGKMGTTSFLPGIVTADIEEMKTALDPIAYIIVRTYSGGKRENLKIFLNEDEARKYAVNNITEDAFIHMETCRINGEFIAENDGRIK